MALTDAEREAVATLTRTLRNMPLPVLRKMAASASPTTAAVARVLLEHRPDAEPNRHVIFPAS
ncbi:hypothetical protein [Amycolatopsis sp. NPDC004378]